MEKVLHGTDTPITQSPYQLRALNTKKMKTKLPFTLAAVLISVILYAQSSTLGNVYIDTNGEMTVYGAHSFANGASGTMPGIVGTERDVLTAHFSFAAGATWTGAADNAHVDGYVRTYQTGAFIFPIGDNGNYSPAGVSASALANPTDAAYFQADPSTAVTSNLKGGSHGALPTGAPFSTASFDAATLTAVSAKEYWDIDGTTAALISLTWDAYSDITTLTASTLANLTIAGWDGTEWVNIPSTVDVTSILGGASALAAGSITTDAAIAPNTYTAYTFGDELKEIYVFPKVFLEGPYDAATDVMTTHLSTNGATSYLATSALTQPYNVAPWSYAGTETVAASFFTTHTDIVDWVLIELRDKTDNSSIVYRRAALLKSDGSIVDTNGTTGILCDGLTADDYYISIRHRNHLGVMGAATVYLDENPLANDIDFTTTATTLYGTGAAEEVEAGVQALHMGNANYTDNIIRFTGANNDKATIGIKVNSTVNINNQVLGYNYEDIDLDGVTAFTGAGNDKAKLGIKLETTVNLNNTITEQLP